MSLINLALPLKLYTNRQYQYRIVVDISRLIVYGDTFFSKDFEVLKYQRGIELVLAGTLAAFLGAFIGSKLLNKITMRSIRILVGVLLFLLALSLGIGIV